MNQSDPGEIGETRKSPGLSDISLNARLYKERRVHIVFWGTLLYAAVVDIKYKRVRRVVWWIAAAAGVVFWLEKWNQQSMPVWRIVSEVLLFVIIQFGLFSKMYGRADCYAFSCCSIVIAALGGGLMEFLFHMLITVFLLGIIQLLRGNVTLDGRLKNPVAFIPYIAASLFVIEVFYGVR